MKRFSINAMLIGATALLANHHRPVNQPDGAGFGQRVRKRTIKSAPVRYIRPRTEQERIIESMTNWQRSQAGKACRGNWRRLTVDQLRHFSSIPHWKEQALSER